MSGTPNDITFVSFMFSEADLLPLSALQHISFCERQCALIHVEQLWQENQFTAEGRIMHERVDTGKTESRGNVRVAFALSLRSLRLGLVGKADVVEFHREKTTDGNIIWRPFPVEYKRGKAKKDNCDRIQLCAQAICLEEMLGIEIPTGALFYGKTRRRQEVGFDEALRSATSDAARKLHTLISSGLTPKAVYSSKCDACSFLEICLPKTMGKPKSAIDYLEKIVNAT